MQIPSHYVSMGKDKYKGLADSGEEVYVQSNNMLVRGTLYHYSVTNRYYVEFGDLIIWLDDQHTVFGPKPKRFASLPDGDYVVWLNNTSNDLKRATLHNGSFGAHIDDNVYALYQRVFTHH